MKTNGPAAAKHAFEQALGKSDGPDKRRATYRAWVESAWAARDDTSRKVAAHVAADDQQEVIRLFNEAASEFPDDECASRPFDVYKLARACLLLLVVRKTPARCSAHSHANLESFS